MNQTNVVTANKDEAEGIQGMVLYSDGGSRPNPGFGGWGLHGYLYSTSMPKKGSGNPDHVLTDLGYVLKSEALSPDTWVTDMNDSGELETKQLTKKVSKGSHKPVTPIHYVDGYGSFNRTVTNNIAELTAAYYGLMHAAEFNVKVIRLYTDSEYVRKGMEAWVKSWKRNGWKRSNGEEIPNVEDWKRLDAIRDSLVQKDIVVEFHWIKAHNDLLGNIKADRLATIGVCHSIDGVFRNELKSSLPDGYWKYETEQHPFINHRCLYFNTRADTMVPGEYYLGNHGKEDDEFGNRMADGAVAVVQLKNPDPIIEMLLAHQAGMADEGDNLMTMVLASVFKSNVHCELTEHGRYATYRTTPSRLDLEGMDKEVLTKQFSPTKMAFRGIENIGMIAEKLKAYQRGDANLIATDLTPILYETVVKTTKKGSSDSLVLRTEFKVGFAALTVLAAYKPDANDPELKRETVILTLGIDLLDRNGLKRLEPLNPKVTLLTWMESELGFRHATVIEVDDAVGIWAGPYANIRVLLDKPAVATQP